MAHGLLSHSKTLTGGQVLLIQLQPEQATACWWIILANLSLITAAVTSPDKEGRLSFFHYKKKNVQRGVLNTSVLFFLHNFCLSEGWWCKFGDNAISQLLGQPITVFLTEELATQYLGLNSDYLAWDSCIFHLDELLLLDYSQKNKTKK